MIELLVVMAVIAILAGIMLMGTRHLRRAAVRAKTTDILHAVQLAFGEGGHGSGAAAAPVEHPLAGSAAPVDFPKPGAKTPRALFVRHATGAVLPVSGEALVVDDPAILSVDRDRILLDDDHFSGQSTEGDLPLLYGLRRSDIGILGVTADWISGHRRLPPLGTGYDDRTGRFLKAPYDQSVYADDRFLVRTALPARRLLDDAMTAGIRVALGPQYESLVALGAIQTSPIPKDVDQEAAWMAEHRDVTEPISGTWDPAHRVWIDPGSAGAPAIAKAWEPGRFKLKDGWHRYRLRGAALYDAWGREILFTMDRGGVRLISAGEDGVFRWHPGRDGIFQTAPNADAPYGDDQDGSLDNIKVGPP